MSSPADELSEIRQHIKLELRRLSDRETELNDKLGGLKAYIAHLEALLEKDAHASSNLTLEEVVRLAELKTKIRPGFFKMSKYAIRKELEEKLDAGRRELGELLAGLDKIKQSKEEANVCPDCSGSGEITETRYEREDGMVRRLVSVSQCSLCEGKGRID